MGELPLCACDTHLHLTMKNNKPKRGLPRLFVALTLLVSPFLQQCTQDKNLIVEPIESTTGNELAGNKGNSSIASIRLHSSTPFITANGRDTLVLSAMAYNEQGLRIDTAGFEIFHNNRKITQQDFATTEPGEHEFVARLGQLSSDTLTIEALHAGEITQTITRVEISASTELIIADGKSSTMVRFTCFGADGQEINDHSDWTLYVNGKAVEGQQLTSKSPGQLRVVAKIGEVESNELVIQARPDKYYEIVTIPLVFHIGHFGESVGSGANIPTSLVKKILDDLNRAYANEFGSTNPNAVDMRVRFRFAHADEHGKSFTEAGVIRYNLTTYDQGHGNNTAFNRALGLAEWRAWQEAAYLDPASYYNVWLYPAEENWSGLANYPSMGSDHLLPGITGFDPGRRSYFMNTHFNMPAPRINTLHRTAMATTVIHEIAHTLGLRHTFSDNDCASSDYSPDTYSYHYPRTDQPCHDNKGLKVPNENFMDYRGSRNTFTYDQRERVRHAIQHSLWFPELIKSGR